MGASLNQTRTSAFRVLKKYIPTREKPGRFFVQLEDGSGTKYPSMFPESDFGRFEVGDHAVMQGYHISKNWLIPDDGMVFYASDVPSEERTFSLGYVSQPRKIGAAYYFVSKLGGDDWLRVSYDVAAEYFLGVPRQTSNGVPTGDYYSRLEVLRTASPDEIKAAYRQKARETHPDAGGSARAFQAIQEAYDCLRNEAERSQYDRLLLSHRATPSSAQLARVQDTVRRWPASGAGQLTCLAEHRGDTWIVKRILAYQRDRREYSGEVLLANVSFSGTGARVSVPDLGKAFSLRVPDLPFRPRSSLNNLLRHLELCYTVTSVARAGFNFDEKRPVIRWEVEDFRVDEWPEEFLEAVR